ncbi:MAG: rayT [Phycisphaerales bacterium]|nr:rayT [Phycisphaerales bacterium]
MPRVGRIAPGGVIYHVLNRGNGRMQLFYKDGDYAAFLKLLARVKESVPVRVLGYCLMPNHWHLVLWPRMDGDLSSFMLRLTTAHVRRHHAHYRHSAGGHLYQGRFKNFPVQEDRHLLTLCRYVEANPLRAKLVRRAQAWRWSSLSAGTNGAAEGLLDAWPIERPSDWLEIVNTAAGASELEAIRTSVKRGRPFGSPQWVARTADRLGLGFTLRDRGRPKKKGRK